jgi:hypothetical protein
MDNVMDGLRERMKMEVSIQVKAQQSRAAETIHRMVADVIHEACKTLENEMRDAIGLRQGYLTKDAPLRQGVGPMLASLRDRFSLAVLSEPSLREVQERFIQNRHRYLEDAMRIEIEAMARDVVREALGLDK